MGSSEKYKFICRPADKAPEKSNFTQTCSLLSQFLKDMRSRGDLSLGMSHKERPEMFQPPVTTMNFLMNMENLAEGSLQNGVASTSSAKPEFIDLDPPSPIKDSDRPDSRESAKEELEIAAQMTIFYAGQVMVFNDFPAEKAKQIMDLAMKESSGKPSSSLSNIDLNKTDSDNSMPSEKHNTPECLRQPSQDPQSINGSDLPIARRASLHRFLNKRKDRVTAKAPYPPPPPVNQRNSPPTKPEESHSRNEEEGGGQDCAAGGLISGHACAVCKFGVSSATTLVSSAGGLRETQAVLVDLGGVGCNHLDEVMAITGHHVL